MIIQYIFQRACQSIFVFIGISIVVFLITLMTGDPARVLLPETATEEDIQLFRKELGLDQPLPVQYWRFFVRAIRLDFGRSLTYRVPALTVVMERMGATLLLTAMALFIQLIIAFPAGIFSALNKGTLWDDMILGTVLLLQSIPVFLSGILFIILFGVHWRILPTSGYGTLKHALMPALTLGLYTAVRVTRMLRSGMIEIFGEDYIRTAKAKGLSLRVITLKHTMRNALIPVVTLVGMEAGILLGASVVTETLFAWPGIGQLLVNAIHSRDFPLVQAGVFIVAAAFVLINLSVDIVYAFIDPRIRYGRGDD